MVGAAPLASVASRCSPSVCQMPDGMKQNCSEPVSRMLRSTSDRASFSPGFSINFFGGPAKDGAPSTAVNGAHLNEQEGCYPNAERN